MRSSAVYEIRLGEVLDEKWAAYFSPFEMTLADGETVLIGPAQDQAQLLGLLIKVSNLGLTLISVNRLYTNQG